MNCVILDWDTILVEYEALVEELSPCVSCIEINYDRYHAYKEIDNIFCAWFTYPFDQRYMVFNIDLFIEDLTEAKKSLLAMVEFMEPVSLSFHIKTYDDIDINIMTIKLMEHDWATADNVVWLLGLIENRRKYGFIK